MNKKGFFNLVKDNYYENQETTLAELCEMYNCIAPIFGTLIIEIEKSNKNTIIMFIDNDDGVFTTSMTLHLDKKNVIKAVEHGLSIFTSANKDLILFYGSLIGKKIKDV